MPLDRVVLASSLLLIGSGAFAGAPRTDPRVLTFEDRVAAQEAIERVYYRHQIGTTEPFEDAVPRAALEAKVERYLAESRALGAYWKTEVTEKMLRRELERMARGSRMPERLLEVYAALGNDPVLIEECLARPILVDRLTHGFYALDSGLHAEARAVAEELRLALATGELSPFAEHPSRTVVEYLSGPEPDLDPSTRRVLLSQADLVRRRAEVPSSPGMPSEVRSTRDSFVVGVVLAESEHSFREARYVLPKLSWDRWWQTAKGPLSGARSTGVVAAAGGFPPLPHPSGPPCVPEDTWDNGALQDPPGPRFGHTAVWTGSVMLVWGNDETGTGWRYDPATDTWAAISTAGAPSPRGRHTAIWTGREMVVWGGHAVMSSDYLATGARYDPATDSWTPTSTVGAPSPRADHVAIWTGSTMVVWAGGGPSRLNNGGRYDPATDTWSPTSIVGVPPPVLRPTAVWTGSSMLVWGGSTAGADCAGRYDPVADAWSPMSSIGAPSRRYRHTAVWTGSRMVVWGGYDGSSSPALGTGGRYDPATDSWTSTSIIGAPSARYDHTAVWTGSRMVVWGGTGDENGGSALGTGGRYDPVSDTWTSTSPNGAPSTRDSHSAVWTGNLMLVWGGRGDSITGRRSLATGARYDPITDSWTPTALVGSPATRYGHTAVWTGNLMLVWGGDDTGLFETGERYDPVTDAWTTISTVDAPSPRFGHTAVWTGSRMIVWGGGFTRISWDTGGRYDPISDTWTPTSAVDAPRARSWHTAVWTGSRMVVWGGLTTGGYAGAPLGNGARYDPTTDTWSATSEVGAPLPRDRHTGVWTGDSMIVWGGRSNGEFGGPEYDDGARYDPVADAWTPISSSGAPSGRSMHTAVWTGSRMVVWGGRAALGGLDTGGRYDPWADAWLPTSTVGAPSVRVAHTTVWTGSRMVVWGGIDGDYSGPPLDTGGRYDPYADVWLPTSTLDAPSPRSGHTAVWTGSSMIVWGGDSRGGRYLPGGAADPPWCRHRK